MSYLLVLYNSVNNLIYYVPGVINLKKMISCLNIYESTENLYHKIFINHR